MNTISQWLYNSGVLYRIQKPARYIAGEYNLKIKKDFDFRVALAFPDVYEIGMSHLGLRILLEAFNSIEGVFAERVFLPWIDMIEEMKKAKIPLFSLETMTPVKEFDLLAITVQYELSFSNIIHLLDLSQIPILSENRRNKDPIVIAGGPAVSNPEPLAEFIDAFYIGEGEEAVNEIIEALKSGKDRKEKMKNLAQIEGIYVPSFYELKESKYGFLIPKIDKRVRIRKVKDLNESIFPINQLVPITEIIHDRAVVEIMRGCMRGCRFCHAGFFYRPARERDVDKIVKMTEDILSSTGYEEISFLSLSTLDYSKIDVLLDKILPVLRDKRVAISLPSSRVDRFGLEIALKVSETGKKGLTFAPEAGNQRLRDVINKNISEEEIFEVIRVAKEKSWRRLKLYFMIGLPEESEEDVESIVELVYRIKREFKIGITVNVSIFVPKPHTPFERAKFYTPWEIKDRIRILKKLRRIAQLKIHDPYKSYLEAIFSRGDRRLSRIILKATLEKGAIFDEWKEFFNFYKWKESFEEMNLNPTIYTDEIPLKEELPWKIFDLLLKEDFLLKEYEKSIEAKLTPDCRFSPCYLCGVCLKTGYRNILAKV